MPIGNSKLEIDVVASLGVPARHLLISLFQFPISISEFSGSV
jgi:hypothetical protein